jgi:hypothetical protein
MNVGCGQRLPGLLTFYDRESSSWKTPQGSLFEPLPTFLEIWPRAGLMLNGRVYRLPLWVRLTKDGDFWLLLIGDHVKWKFRRLCATLRPCTGKRSSGANRTELYAFMNPTPTASDATSGPEARGGKFGRGGNLAGALKVMHSTPLASDAKGSLGNRRGDGKPKSNLAREVRILALATHPSPRADSRDNAGGANSRRTAKANGTYFGQTLNPEYVEWLQGFPIGWTDLDASATPLSPK